MGNSATVVAFGLHQSCSQEPPHESEEQLGGHRVQGGDAGAWKKTATGMPKFDFMFLSQNVNYVC